MYVNCFMVFIFANHLFEQMPDAKLQVEIQSFPWCDRNERDTKFLDCMLIVGFAGYIQRL